MAAAAPRARDQAEGQGELQVVGDSSITHHQYYNHDFENLVELARGYCIPTRIPGIASYLINRPGLAGAVLQTAL